MPDPSTEMGGGARGFPATHWSVIRDARDPQSPTCRKSLGELASVYWRPVYAYFRRRWRKGNEEAKDLTQDFFLALSEREFLPRPSPEQGRFRSYVLAALDNFARLEHRRDSTKKRGGGVRRFSIDGLEGFEPSTTDPPDQVFLREWAGSVLDEALRDLEEDYRSRGMEHACRIFLRQTLEPEGGTSPSYEDLAREFSVSVTEVRNILHRARKRLREMVVNRVRDTVQDETHVEEEMRDLFGEHWS